MRHSALTQRIAMVAGAVTLVGLGAGCSSSKSSEASSASGFAAKAPAAASGGVNGGGVAQPALPNAAQDAKAGGSTGAANAAPPATDAGQNSLSKVPVAGRSLVYTATLTVRTKDVAGATANAETLAAANGGFVGDEKSESGTVPDVKGLTESTVTLRVPSTAFDKVIGELGTGGVVQDETRSASDVTSQVVDTTTRITAQEAAIARITDLMKNAGNLSDVVTLEGELSRREADLESMQAQLAALNDQVSLSTITVTYLVPEAPSPTPQVKHQNALQRGLHDGWNAFLNVVKVLLVVLGAVLPFVVLVVVLWWPVTRVRRWLLRGRGPAVLAASGAPASGDPLSGTQVASGERPSASAAADAEGSR